MKHFSWRYYTRFRGDYGHLGVEVVCNNARKTATLPVIVSKTQAKRLSNKGKFKTWTNNASDALLRGHIMHYDAVIKAVIPPLIESERFFTLQGRELTDLLVNTYNATSEERVRNIRKRADKYYRQAEDAMRQGDESVQILTPSQFVELVKTLRHSLTPMQYDTLWERILICEEKGGEV